jgi:hypothetical protein
VDLLIGENLTRVSEGETAPSGTSNGQRRAFVLVERDQPTIFAQLCEKTDIQLHAAMRSTRDEEKQRSSLAWALPHGLCRRRDGTNGTLLCGSPGESIGCPPTPIIYSRRALDRAAWTKRRRRNRWNWANCYSSLARFRRAILGRIATAAWREQRPSSDAKRIRCAGHVITSKIELHLRAYSSPMRKGNFDLVERWKQFVTTVVQSSREPVKRKRPNETENRLCERDDGGTCA